MISVAAVISRRSAESAAALRWPARRKHIRLGDIVRLGEESETVIDCIDGENHLCRLLPVCRLKGVLDEAAAAFFAVMDRYTLADLVEQPSKMRAVLGI